MKILSRKKSQTALVIGSIGVVFGDIGTSPLYTISAIFHISNVDVVFANIYGAVSSIFWGLMLVVTLKYVLLIMRADNNGEGGIFSMMALARSVQSQLSKKPKAILLVIGVCGAALFYGDSVITPAITVLSAIEGLAVVAPALSDLIIPITIVIIVLLFSIQRYGTSIVGKSFGPIMVIWFFTIGANGINNILSHPEIIYAINPIYAINFLSSFGPGAFILLGAIVLALTGAEALYADMGHFGKKPIRIAWFSVVLPSLTLCYFGQGAYLASNPTAEVAAKLFFLSFNPIFYYPIFALTTVAAIIASQAVITGAFSISHQAIQMGFLPRMKLVHTSIKEIGQIYIPVVAGVLAVSVPFTIIFFKNSHSLTAAYGLAVTAAMVIDTILAYFVVRYLWKYPFWLIALATLFFLTIDLSLFLACVIKFQDGGWYSLILASIVSFTMLTWHYGRAIVNGKIINNLPPLSNAIDSIEKGNLKLFIAEKSAIYMVSNESLAPQALLTNIKCNSVIHKTNYIVSINTENMPVVKSSEKIITTKLSKHFYQVIIRCGYMEAVDVPKILSKLNNHGIDIDVNKITFFIAKTTIVQISAKVMNPIRAAIFKLMYYNASSAISYYKLPSNQVVELGTKITI